MLQFPFLISGVFLGWVLPQLLGISNAPFIPEVGLQKTIGMSILCLAAAWWGYSYTTRPARLFWWSFDSNRLLVSSAILSLAGAFFFHLVGKLAADVIADVGGQWTGVITIYFFFSRMLGIGMVIALILHLNRPSWQTLFILAFDIAVYMERIVVRGRRAAMVELGLVLVMAFWFNRGWRPSRALMVSSMLIGALVINSIGDYRHVMLGDDRWHSSGAGVQDVLEINFVGNLENIVSGRAANYELLNAVLNIEGADRRGSFDYGLSLWNQFVKSYVPGQLVGQDVKSALMVDVEDVAYEEFKHVAHVGTTSTGMSDSFLSFWYFGALNFFIIGFIIKRWYNAAVSGNLVAQMVLMLTISAALHAVTHSTHLFFVSFIQLAAFLLPVLWFARVRQAAPPIRIETLA